MDDRRISMTQLDSRHEELSAELPKHAPKASVIRLLAHLSELPGLNAAPHMLYYHVDTVARIIALVLEPPPISSHLAFLSDLIQMLSFQPEAVRDRVPLLPVALQRLQVLRAMEFAVRGEWSSARDAAPDENRDSARAQNLDTLREALAATPGGQGLLWPTHLLAPAQGLRQPGVLTVLVDGEGSTAILS